MIRNGFLGSMLLTAITGAALLAPLAASAAPPCPECFYPYRACIRAATTPEERQYCEEEYAACVEASCPPPFLSDQPTSAARLEGVLASRVEQHAPIVWDLSR